MSDEIWFGRCTAEIGQHARDDPVHGQAGTSGGSVAFLHAVYADLEQARPRGVRYDTFRLDGSGSFLALIDR
jgi:hypothetical protein